MVLQRFASVFSRYSDQKTMKYFCNRLFDKMFKSKNVTEDSTVKFGRAIDFHVKDVKLNKLLKKCFGQYNAYEIKSIIENTPDEEISKLSTVDAQRCLMNVINEEKDESIRQFIKMLCLPIQSYLEWCYDEYKTKVGLDEELFPDYVLEDIVKTKYFNKCGFVHSEYCLLSHFIQGNFEEETLMGKNEYLNIEIDLEKCDSIKSIVKMLVTNYQIINNVISAKGNNYSGTFKGALNLVNKLTPVWDKLLASSLMRDKTSSQTPPQASSNNLSDEEMFSVYAGKYSLVPRSYPEVTKISANMIFNMHQFKQLSQQRKKQVCAYLENNKSRFNRLINEVAETIHDELSDKLNYSNIRNLTSTNKLYKCASLLNDSFNSHVFNSPDKLLSYVIHEYIPIIKQFNNLNDDLCENIRKNIYGGAPNNDIVELIRGGLELNDVFDEIYEYKSESKSKPKPEIKYVPQTINNQTQSKPVERIVYKYVSTPSPKVYGGDEELRTTEDYVKALVKIQRKFNEGYESFYRGLIDELNKVKLPDEFVDKTKLYNTIQQFEQIAIKNPKTTCYISGLYSARNYNEMYLDMIKTLISNIEANDYKFLNGVLDKLKEVSDLLKNTSREVANIQIKMLSSPRGDNDYMIMNTRKILKPSNLNSDDFNNLTIAVRKILSSINSTRVESEVYNFKNSLDKFIENVKDRDKMIKEYYELEKQRFIYENQESFFDYKSRNGNVQRINNLLIDRKAEAMCYMNSVVDMELAKVKLKTSESSISEKEMKDIEEIYLNFKYAQSSTEIGEIFDKLKTLETNSFENILTIIKKLKKLFKISGQVKMITEIYRKLKIFPDDFDWNKFEHEYIDLVVLNSMSIGHIYEIKVQNKNYTNTYRMSYSQIVETLANSCELTAGSHLKFKSEDQVCNESKIIYQMINDIFNSSINESYVSKILKIKSSTIDRFLTGDDTVKGVDSSKINNATYSVRINTGTFKTNDWSIIVLDRLYEDIDREMQFTTKATIDTLIGDDRGNSYLYKIMNKLSQIMISKLKYCMFGNKIKNDTPYYIKHWPVPVLQFVCSAVKNYNIENFLKGSISITNSFGVNIIKNRNVECDIAAYSIEALYANIADYIDLYWKLKYNGNIPIVQGISNALRGGSKLNGSSMPDYASIHVANYGEIINEAVPFYVTALNVMDYYIRHFSLSNNDRDDTKMRLRLKFNKLSILYPIYKILCKNLISLNTLTEQYIKECLYPLNKIWNMTDGDLGTKLSKSVDIILNEIHSNFLFTSKASEDILEFTEMPYQETGNMVDLNTEEISRTLKEILKDVFRSSTESNKYLEAYLRNAYETVKNNEGNKLATLRSFLIDNTKNNYYDDFYHFMDLVIAPLLIINKAYKKKFSLFSFYTKNISTYNSDNVLDFGNINVVYLDMTTSTPTLQKSTMSSIITNILNGFSQYKSLLFYNPVVTKYNQNLIRKALADFNKTNKFTVPKFWIVMDEKTYPLKTKNELYNDDLISCKNIDKILQTWGYLDGKTIGDYYNQCITEFISDFNHIIQLFISYPDISDKVIKRLSDALKDSIKIKGIGVDKSSHPYIKLTLDKDYEFNRILDTLASIKISDIRSNSISVPNLKNTQIPPFNETKLIEGLNIINSSAPDAIRIGNSGSYLCIPTSQKDNTKFTSLTSVDYNWIDWVIFMIAGCDTANFCIPYKLVLMLQSQTMLQNYIRLPAYKLRDQKITYNINEPGALNNIITQNIILRSTSDFNKDRLEYSTLAQIQVATIVSMLPYIIGVLKVNLKFLSMKDFNRDEQYTINSLIETLTLFFYDISTFTPYIGFMTDSLELMSGRDKAHSFGEVFADMYMTNNLSTADDFLHLEWANKIFFSYISEIKFPEYKNKSQFAKYDELVKDIIIQPSFKNVYDNTKSIIARNVWSYLLCKNKNKQIVEDNSKLNELIISILYNMSDCDDKVLQKFIDNVIKHYSDNTYIYNNALNKIVESLTEGIVKADLNTPYSILLNLSSTDLNNLSTALNIDNKRTTVDKINKGEKIEIADDHITLNPGEKAYGFLMDALLNCDVDSVISHINHLKSASTGLKSIIEHIRTRLTPRMDGGVEPAIVPSVSDTFTTILSYFKSTRTDDRNNRVSDDNPTGILREISNHIKVMRYTKIIDLLDYIIYFNYMFSKLITAEYINYTEAIQSYTSELKLALDNLIITMIYDTPNIHGGDDADRRSSITFNDTIRSFIVSDKKSKILNINMCYFNSTYIANLNILISILLKWYKLIKSIIHNEHLTYNEKSVFRNILNDTEFKITIEIATILEHFSLDKIEPKKSTEDDDQYTDRKNLCTIYYTYRDFLSMLCIATKYNIPDNIYNMFDIDAIKPALSGMSLPNDFEDEYESELSDVGQIDSISKLYKVNQSALTIIINGEQISINPTDFNTGLHNYQSSRCNIGQFMDIIHDYCNMDLNYEITIENTCVPLDDITLGDYDRCVNNVCNLRDPINRTFTDMGRSVENINECINKIIKITNTDKIGYIECIKSAARAIIDISNIIRGIGNGTTRITNINNNNVAVQNALNAAPFVPNNLIGSINTAHTSLNEIESTDLTRGGEEVREHVHDEEEEVRERVHEEEEEVRERVHDGVRERVHDEEGEHAHDGVREFILPANFSNELKRMFIDELMEYYDLGISFKEIVDIEDQLTSLTNTIREKGSIDGIRVTDVVNAWVEREKSIVLNFKDITLYVANILSNINDLKVKYMSYNKLSGFCPNTLSNIKTMIINNRGGTLEYNKDIVKETIERYNKIFGTKYEATDPMKYSLTIEDRVARLGINDLRTLCNIVPLGYECKYYKLEYTKPILYLSNINTLIKGETRQISIDNKMFGYIFDAKDYRKYYTLSPRCDIQNATIYREDNIDIKYGSYNQIYQNILLAQEHIRDKTKPDELYLSKKETEYISPTNKETLYITTHYFNEFFKESNSDSTKISNANYNNETNSRILKIYRAKMLSIYDNESTDYYDTNIESGLKEKLAGIANAIGGEADIIKLEKRLNKTDDDKLKDDELNKLKDLWREFCKDCIDRNAILREIRDYYKNKVKTLYESTMESAWIAFNSDGASASDKTSYSYKLILPSSIREPEFNREKTNLPKTISPLCDYFDILPPISSQADIKSDVSYDLSRFLNRIMSNSFKNIKVDKYYDTGFATQLKTFQTGGYTKYDNLKDYINLDNYVNGKRGELKYLYDYENDFTDSKRLFDSLFKSYANYYTDLNKRSDIITLSVFNYFHKFNLSCASIYNRILFPNIIYNASILRNYISSLARSIKTVNLNNDRINDIFKFISNLSGDQNKDVLDLINDWRYNIVIGERKSNETYTTFNTSTIRLSNYPQLSIVNVNTTPSLINKFFIDLLKILSPNTTDFNVIDFAYKNSMITSLYNSPFVIEFNHINLLNTIIYSILRILKTTSYYDVETDTDYAYNNGLLLEPFDE